MTTIKVRHLLNPPKLQNKHKAGSGEQSTGARPKAHQCGELGVQVGREPVTGAQRVQQLLTGRAAQLPRLHL